MVFAAACTGGTEDGQSSMTAATSTTRAAEKQTTQSAGGSEGLREAFAAAGVEIIESPEEISEVQGFQLSSWQVVNMEREIDSGGGIVGFDLDELAGAPGGLPFSYLVAGWITGAGTQAADDAARIMGDQDWEVAPSLVYPTAVLMLFVADSLLAAGVTGSASIQPALVPIAAEPQDICTRLSNWVQKALNWIFDGLRIDVAGDEWYAWAANIWNAAVDLAEKALRKAIEVITETLLAPIQKALAVIGTVSMVVSTLKTWSYKIIPPDETPELAVGNDPDNLATATLLANTGLPEWPKNVAGCAERAGTRLPDPASAADSNVTWRIGKDAFPKNRASIVESGTDDKINDENTADVVFNPGRDEGDEPFPGWIHLTAVVEKDQIGKLRDMVWTLLTGKLPEEAGDDYVSAIGTVIWTITEPIWKKLIQLLADTAGPKRIDVIHHVEVDFAYPTEDTPDDPGNEQQTRIYPPSRFEPDVPLKITYIYDSGDSPPDQVVVAWDGEAFSKTVFGTTIGGFLDSPSDFRVRHVPGQQDAWCEIVGAQGCVELSTWPSPERNALFEGHFGEIPSYMGSLPAIELTHTEVFAGWEGSCGTALDADFGEVALCVHEESGAILYVHTIGRCNDPNRTDESCAEAKAILIEQPTFGDFVLPMD